MNRIDTPTSVWVNEIVSLLASPTSSSINLTFSVISSLFPDTSGRRDFKASLIIMPGSSKVKSILATGNTLISLS